MRRPRIVLLRSCNLMKSVAFAIANICFENAFFSSARIPAKIGQFGIEIFNCNDFCSLRIERIGDYIDNTPSVVASLGY